MEDLFRKVGYKVSKEIKTQPDRGAARRRTPALPLLQPRCASKRGGLCGRTGRAMVYVCSPGTRCAIPAVMAHPGTLEMGAWQGRKLRQLRYAAHREFNKLYQSDS